MATTVTTLIEAINRVLLDIGERQVTTVSNPASRKAKAFLQDAYRDMQEFHDWSWSYHDFTASSWSNDEATYSGLKRVRRVLWDSGDTNPKTLIPFVSNDLYERYQLESFNDTDDPNKQPLRFTIIDDDTLLFNPYPTDATSRGKIVVWGYEYFEPPSFADDTFSMPERFMSILIKRAVYMMLLRHLGDLQAAQYHEGEFATLLNYQKSKEFRTPTGGVNMHRQGRF